MAKEKVVKDSKKEKKEKKRSEEDGVHKKSKDKKEKKPKTEVLTSKFLNAIEDGETTAPQEEITVEEVETPRVLGALVPFANPLADDKVSKKLFKGVKKAAASKTLKRGVKEVVKALRKSAPLTTAAANSTTPSIVILAADISPMDVISHIPVLCEDHKIPYIYVQSRAELGAAGQTKRPTSVVMITNKKGGKAGAEGGEDADWKETYEGLVKVVEKEGVKVKI